MVFHEDEDDGLALAQMPCMLVMIGLCNLMSKHGIKPSLSKSQHTRVTKNGLGNIRRTRQCTGKDSRRPGLKMLGNKAVRCRIPV